MTLQKYYRFITKHPGFPEIGAISAFRANIEDEFGKGQQKLDEVVREIRVKNGEPLEKRNTRGAIRSSKYQGPSNTALKSPIQLRGFFDTSHYKTLNKEIRNEIMRHMAKFMAEALEISRVKTQQDIGGGPREFKGKYLPTQPHPDDMYNKIADSLRWYDNPNQGQANQFTRYIAGSYDKNDTDLAPTGVKGRRGYNLIELTEKGLGAYDTETHPIRGTARLHNAPWGHMKGR
jgi:hypothetical protein